MSILKNSIPTNGQPIFPAKGSTTRDAPLCHITHPLKPFQPNSNKNPSVIASGESVPVYKMYDPKKERFQNSLSHLLDDDQTKSSAARDIDFEPIALHFLCPPSKDAMVELEHDFSSEPNVAAVLAVAVSSAVKLEDTQINLIARKMQRLTGFRHLRLENVVDPSLIAGFVISIDDSHVIDFSVKGQLAALAAQVESSDQRLANRGKSWSSNC